MGAPHPPRPAEARPIEDAGDDAPWLVMVHGNSQDGRAFSGVLPAYRDDYRLLVVDLPGHGASSAIPGPYGAAEHARAVAAAIDAAGIERMHFWGTHTGASVALILASREPGRFASLVLEGPVIPGDNPPSVTEALALARKTATERGIEAARAEWWERSGWFRVMREHPQACRAAEHLAMLEDFAGGPWTDRGTPEPVVLDDAALARIAMPVLVLNGEHDLADFLAVSRRLSRVLPDARLASVAGGGGFPLWEVPDAVNALVAPFLAGLAG